MRPWYGVDLDGTLAMYDGFKGSDVIGEPIESIVNLVKQWLAEDKEVRVFTARVWHDGSVDRLREATVARMAIDHWCLQVFDTVLPVTCQKDYGMVLLLDDRAFHVVTNTGIIVPASNEVNTVHVAEAETI